jgi:glycosyltransferase involved in cell wall biosynthesis
VRICIIGKFPPIQGGVSMRTYWTAHALAACGHDVHVVTNAKEVAPPFRMHMRLQDWTQCECVHGLGCVTVHWSDPIDRSQSYIPMSSPFVSKLATIAAQVHSEHPFDVIFSFYMEPYGVAGHLAADMTGTPHVVRMAGSDAGRLWHHPQLAALYDHVLRSAQAVIIRGDVARRAIERGVDARRIADDGGFAVPEDLFNPDGPALDLAALREEVDADADLKKALWGEFRGGRPYYGMYGKLGAKKGSFALLAAMHRLKQKGRDVGLVALAHGSPDVERAFRARVSELGLVDRVLQLPYLPHWRIPAFLRGCLAVCCLEQDFPIRFHSPITPREVLLCGACLVASTELIRKLPGHRRLPHGYGCVAIADVNNVDALSDRLAAIVDDPEPAKTVGRRGRAFARELQQGVPFPQALAHILEAAAGRNPAPASKDDTAGTGDGRFTLTQLAAAELQERLDRGVEATCVALPASMDLAAARRVLAALEGGTSDCHVALRRFIPAVRTEIAIATAESEASAAGSSRHEDPLFRLFTRRWGIDDEDLAKLIPVRDANARIVRFDYDVCDYLGVKHAAQLPAAPARRPSHIIAFAASAYEQRSPLVVDTSTVRMLELSDGTRTAGEIAASLGGADEFGSHADALKWIEYLFVCGLVRLDEVHLRAPVEGPVPGGTAPEIDC